MMFCSIRVNSVARNLWNSLLLLVIWLLDLWIGKSLQIMKFEKCKKEMGVMGNGQQGPSAAMQTVSRLV